MVSMLLIVQVQTDKCDLWQLKRRLCTSLGLHRSSGMVNQVTILVEVIQCGAPHVFGVSYALGTLDKVDAEPRSGHLLRVELMFVGCTQ